MWELLPGVTQFSCWTGQYRFNDSVQCVITGIPGQSCDVTAPRTGDPTYPSTFLPYCISTYSINFILLPDSVRREATALHALSSPTRPVLNKLSGSSSI